MSRSSGPYLALLDRLTRVFHSSLNPKVILKMALVDTVRLIGATSGSVILINPESSRLEIEASVGLSNRGRRLQLQLGEGITGWVALHGKPLRIDDVRKDSRYIPARASIRSELAVPLERIGEQRGATDTEARAVIGVLNVDSTRLSAFTQIDEKLLMTLGGQVSSLIQNAWLYEQTHKRATQLDALLQLGQSIMATDTLPEILRQVTRGACKLLGADFCDVLLLDADGEYLEWHMMSDKVQLQTSPIPVDNSQIGTVVRRRKPMVVYDLQKSDPLLFASLSHRNRLSLLGVPLFVGEQVLGVLAFYRQIPHRFSNDEIQMLSALANQAALSIQRCNLSARLVITEEELRQSERLSAIGLLAAEVAHEIRNPLTVIKMLTHNLQKELPQEDARRKDFEILTRKMDQMNHTVERVLGLARSSEPVFELLQLNSIIEDLVLLIRHKVAHQKVQLKIVLAKNLPLVRFDRAQLEQALLNIVLNALHAMSSDGILGLATGYSSSRNHHGKPCLWIEVRDSGIGMSPIQKEKLFQPFLTSRVAGTGLGMAIVNKIVQAHHGELVVRSRAKRGTTMRIYLKPEAMA